MYTIPAGITALQVSVDALDDSSYEGDETFTLTATATDPNVTTTDSGLGTIKDGGVDAGDA